MWRSGPTGDRIACASLSNDGCYFPGICDRPPDDSIATNTPPGGIDLDYGTEGAVAFRCEQTANPGFPCEDCEIRFYRKFYLGCPTLCANAVRMPLSNQCPANTTASIQNPGWCCPLPSPSPTPPPGNGCNTCSGTFAEMCEFDNADRPGQPPGGCCKPVERDFCILGGGIWNANTCVCSSPIVVDVMGNGYDLTGAEDGISFDLGATGTPTQIAWTSAGSDDAWLALDRNGNGTIDRGMELFGDRTPQPFLAEGEIKNGFRALAVFDRFDRGGNADGFITNADSVFADLRLWQDTNHNGYSELEELHALPELGLVKIDLDYRESRRRDEHGNWFRFRSKVRDVRGRQLGRWAWDVWLVTQ